MKKAAALILTVMLIFISACSFLQKEEEQSPADANDSGSSEQIAVPAAPKLNAAVFLPDDNEHKWRRSAEYISEALERWGFETELFTADGDDELQAAHINGATASSVDCIIVAPVDSYSDKIREAVEKAKRARIPVIAYDRLVMNTDAVDVFVAFDPYLTGRICGQYVESALSIGSGQPLNIEFLFGSGSDSSAPYFYYGALDVLMPHINAGRLNVPSGYESFEQASVDAPERSRAAMSSRIDAYYSDGRKLDAVVAADDDLALGAIKALDETGHGADSTVVVGVGCHRENVIEISEGRQAASVFTDERLIAEKIAEAANWLANSRFPAGVDRTTFNNGNKIVPALLLEPVLLDDSNYRDLLIGGEYYSYKDINP